MTFARLTRPPVSLAPVVRYPGPRRGPRRIPSQSEGLRLEFRPQRPLNRSRWREGVPLFALALALAACSKSEDRSRADTSTASSSSPASADAQATRPQPTTGKAASYGGTYQLTPAALYIPTSKDYASVKQAKDDPTKQVGEGTLTVVIAADGRVTGTIDSGPASPATLDGRLLDSELRANVRRRDPKDDGLTGTLVGTIQTEDASGTLSLAEANAAIVREGKFSLKRK